ncbi:MAG: alpha/beta fold hydrolase [Lautropia sp.]|nr:alpha/beta fold hydrolase [Lautropia sp.]
MRLIYLHGFRSSSRSFKARLLQARFAAAGRAEHFLSPDLPVEPDHAIGLVREMLKPVPDDTLVGSSLGGFYATWLAEQTGCRAVLLNPAVHPARDLAGQVGPQVDYHDGEPFEFEAHHVEQLRRYEVARITRPERYFLVAAQGDELLDWTEMVAAFPGARHRIVAGSDHGLADFESYIEEVLAFAGFGPAGEQACD